MTIVASLRRLLPGVVLCCAVTVLAIALQAVEVRIVGQAYIEVLVLAILLGVIIRSTWTPAACFHPGIAFSAKTLLEIAVMLLGASLSASAVIAIGPR